MMIKKSSTVFELDSFWVGDSVGDETGMKGKTEKIEIVKRSRGTGII